MLSAFQLWEALYPCLFALGGLLVVGYRWERTPWIRRGVDRALRTLLGPHGLSRVRLWQLVALAGGAMVAAVAYDYATQFFACRPTGVDDPVNLWLSGRSFLTGGDPFVATSCGYTVDVPYGLAAVLLDAAGYPGGLVSPGAGALTVWLVWFAVSLLILPLVWSLGGEDRLYVTVLVGSSLLYLPIVIGQVDGASNAIVPVGVLTTVWLSRRRPARAGVVGGILATARWPALFPSLGAFGRSRGWQRWLAPFGAVASFSVLTAATYARWGSAFTDSVFFSQISRFSGSLNAFGILIDNGWAPAGLALTALQAAGTLLLVFEVNRRRFAPEAGAVVVLVGIALLTQFLSLDILIWLLPAALLGAAPQRSLYLVGVIGLFNYGFLINVLAWQDGIYLPSEIMEAAMTVVLLVLFWQVWRIAAGRSAREEVSFPPSPEPPVGAAGTPARSPTRARVEP